MIDTEKVLDAIEAKHHVRLDQHDPVLQIGTMVDAVQREALTALGAIVQEASAKIDAVVARSEIAARGQADAIITEAARWSAERIKAAGVETAKLISEHLETHTARAEQAAQIAAFAGWLAAGSAAATCVVLASIIWLR